MKCTFSSALASSALTCLKSPIWDSSAKQVHKQRLSEEGNSSTTCLDQVKVAFDKTMVAFHRQKGASQGRKELARQEEEILGKGATSLHSLIIPQRSAQSTADLLMLGLGLT